MSSEEDRLKSMSDAELQAIVADVEQRAELFDTRIKSLINDELRRRRKKVIRDKRYG